MTATRRAECTFRQRHVGGIPRIVRLAAVWCLSLAVPAAALAQPASRQQEKRKEVEPKVLTTRDGFSISITYFNSVEGKRAPVVVMLHMENGNRRVWDGMARTLQNQGFAVVTVDLRKHGESVAADAAPPARGRAGLTAGDYRAMVSGDLEAVKAFILEEHEKGNLNIRKMGIVAAGMSAPPAIHFTLNDWLRRPWDDHAIPARRTPRGQDVQALVLLSPSDSVSGLSAAQPLAQLRTLAPGLSVMVGYATDDNFDRGHSRKIFQRIAPGGQQDGMYLQEYETKFRGTDLLGKQIRVEEHMLAFLNRHLMDLPDEWQTRISRLQGR